MSATNRTASVAERAVTLAELREFYAYRVDVLARSTRPNPLRANALATATRCQQLAEELEVANDALLAATRALR